MEWVTQPESWIALLTLTALEIVLGVDNIIFISILVGKLPQKDRQRARILGLFLAMFTRLALLLTLAWMIKLTKPLFIVFKEAISGRDLILLFGGLFLLVKAVMEIHSATEGNGGYDSKNIKYPNFWVTLFQIALIDIVFSLDSVITAVGMANNVTIMVLAIIVSVFIMMFAAKPIGEFVEKHPTIKMLALSFLMLVGTALIGESFDMNIPKGYIYFAMAFSVGVEVLNLNIRKKQEYIVLNKGVVKSKFKKRK